MLEMNNDGFQDDDLKTFKTNKSNYLMDIDYLDESSYPDEYELDRYTGGEISRQSKWDED